MSSYKKAGAGIGSTEYIGILEASDEILTVFKVDGDKLVFGAVKPLFKQYGYMKIDNSLPIDENMRMLSESIKHYEVYQETMYVNIFFNNDEHN